MLAWSIISLLTYMAHDYSTMLACRFLLGITEAPVSLNIPILATGGQHKLTT